MNYIFHNLKAHACSIYKIILNKSWTQYPTKPQPYDHQHPITKTIKVRRTRHA